MKLPETQIYGSELLKLMQTLIPFIEHNLVCVSLFLWLVMTET